MLISATTATLCGVSAFAALQLLEAALAIDAVQHGQGQASGVAFFAHIGGFVLGMVLALLVKVVGPAQPSLPANCPRNATTGGMKRCPARYLARAPLL